AYGASRVANTAGSVILYAPVGSVTVGNIDASGHSGSAGGTVDLSSVQTLTFGSTTPTALGVTGISVSGDAHAGTVLLSSATLLQSLPGLTGNVITASSLNGAGGNVVVTSAGSQLGVGVSLVLGGVDISGVDGGSLQVYSMDPNAGSLTVGN